MHHIRDCLPEIKSKLNVMMQSVTQELSELGEPTDCVSVASLGATLVRNTRKTATGECPPPPFCVFVFALPRVLLQCANSSITARF